ncbi:TIM barrel protein [Planktotalea sp.]|uniref:hydroxypyruvate isomerase family protein n=1 Tax=Planktotalea sp. TaxID=2029877 RepID=UPI0032985E55
MTKFSANLGFLWTDLPLPDAIHAAKRAGFDAVEFHWPYEVPVDDIKAALTATGLPLLGLNTRRGNVEAGENGLSALVDREEEALAAIRQSIDYASALGAGAIHVMAGNAAGPAAHEIFLRNLTAACVLAAPHDIDILIEPLNQFDAPDYFLRDSAQAQKIIEEVSASNLKLMFDCYHVGRTEGDVFARLNALLPIIGHIQFASVPERGRPDQGTLDYGVVFDEITKLGWDHPLGAEYKPGGATEETLGWMAEFT